MLNVTLYVFDYCVKFFQRNLHQFAQSSPVETNAKNPRAPPALLCERRDIASSRPCAFSDRLGRVIWSVTAREATSSARRATKGT